MLTPDPKDPERQEDECPPSPGNARPAGPRQVPDWLTGSDDGLLEELEAGQQPDAPERPRPVLHRPGQAQPGAPARPSSAPILRAVPGASPGPAASPSTPHATPRLSVVPPDTPDLEQRQELGPAPDVQPESDLMRAYEFTAPESATPPASGPHAGAAEAAEQEPASPSHAGRPQRPDPDAPRPWAPAASSVPVPRLALSAETQPAKSQESVGLEAPARGLPGAAEDRKAVPPAPPPAPPPLQEPWWLIALDTVRSNRKAQIGAAGALAALVLLGSWMWPHGTGTTPISRVRRYPAQYDGRNVAVRGRVGDDVFPVGDGWAFYLLQGRDTMVTFSRVRSPRPHDVVTVKGLVSVGFLDGVPRQAMFEESAAPK